MLRKVFLFSLLAGLAGCAAGPSLQSRMAAYTGDSARQLVQTLGVPDKQVTVDGVQYFAYTVRHVQQVAPNDILAGGFEGPFYGPYYPGGFIDAGLPSQIQNYSCETTFTLVNGHVTGFSLRGNDCT